MGCKQHCVLIYRQFASRLPTWGTMPRMTQKGDNEDFKAWLRESVLALCRGGLSYRKDFSIEGVLGITIDHSDVLLVRIHDKDTTKVSKCEKATQVCYTDRETTHFHDTPSTHVSVVFSECVLQGWVQMERWSRGRAPDCQSRGQWFNPTCCRFET